MLFLNWQLIKVWDGVATVIFYLLICEIILYEGCAQNVACSYGNMPVYDAAFPVSLQSLEVLDL